MAGAPVAKGVNAVTYTLHRIGSPIKGKGQWIDIDPERYDPIAQGVVVVRRDGGNIADAEAFSQYLFSEEAQNVLSTFGYLKCTSKLSNIK